MLIRTILWLTAAFSTPNSSAVVDAEMAIMAPEVAPRTAVVMYKHVLSWLIASKKSDADMGIISKPITAGLGSNFLTLKQPKFEDLQVNSSFLCVSRGFSAKMLISCFILILIGDSYLISLSIVVN